MAKSEPSILGVKSILEHDQKEDESNIIVPKNFINKDCQNVSNEFHAQNTIKNDNDEGNHHDVTEKSLSISSGSLSISIVTMENAGDSSIVDSDSETEDNLDGKYMKIRKLGQQSSFAPNSAELQDLNKGLKIICQHITPNENLKLNKDISEFEINNGSIVGSSKIGSIALSNSTNVQFGDKHFYEGPVTIQQFLIENRKNDLHNAAYDNIDFKSDDASNNADVVSHANLQENNDKYFWIRKGIRLKAFTIFTTVITLAVITLMSIYFYNITEEKLNIEEKTFITTNTGKFRLIRRNEWSARNAKSKLNLLKLPVHHAIIQHTVSAPCYSDEICMKYVKFVQNLHMDSNDWSDIGYNFLVGSEGQIIEGRGWLIEGAHTYPYNRDSVGIAFIGSFNSVPPSEKQVKALELFLEWGVTEKKLTPDYRLYGAKQLKATESPGIILNNIIRNFPHWSDKIDFEF